MNIFLLRRARQGIVDNPEGYDQYSWVCDDACCIVGLAAKIAGEPIRGELDILRAQQLLKLNDDQFSRLAHWGNWPEPLRSEYAEYRMAEDYKSAADVAVRRIDKFVETDGAE